MYNINEILNKLTLVQKASLMSGKDHWTTVGIEQLNIPSLFLADGPHGIRKQAGESDHLGLNPSIKATCYPTASAIANSWDEELIEEMGQHLGDEAKSLGVDMILGPGLNIKRNPLCGRNFEYFSEDPILSGKIAAAMVRGIQSKGIIACPKHLAVNNQEYQRMVSDSIIDERTLREVYLTGFEIVVKEARPKSIMSSYNKINGVYANENSHLLQKILKDEWNFDGLVVSDWGGSNDHILGVKNGSHLEMPSTSFAGIDEIVQAVKNGQLDEKTLDQRVKEILEVILDKNFNNGKRTEEKFDINKHHEFARKVARESIVLLKNKENILPLSKHQKIAIIGEFAEQARYQGAGSSLVNPTRLDSLLKVIETETEVDYVYARGFSRNQINQKDLIDEAIKVASCVDTLVVCVGLDESSEVEGRDRSHLRMPMNQLNLLKNLISLNKKMVVILSSGSVIEMPWLDHVDGVLHTFLSGQAGASATKDILFGDACPNGRLAETYPISYEDVPNKKYYPAIQINADYKEGPYVGYRYYETINKAVQFPFGYGLSYTDYKITNVKQKDKTSIEFIIKNTGLYDGAEVVQLYVSRNESTDFFRPKTILSNFVKVNLSKGESKKCVIKIDEKALRVYNDITQEFIVENGIYTLKLGTHVRNIIWTNEIEITNGSFPQSNKIIKNRQEKLKSYFTGAIENVTDEEFNTLLSNQNHLKQVKSKYLILERNSTLSDLKGAKSLLGRFVFKVLNQKKLKAEKDNRIDMNMLFIFNMPFRNISKMTGGLINMEMVDSILTIVNGNEIRGIYHLLTSFMQFNKRKKSYINEV